MAHTTSPGFLSQEMATVVPLSREVFEDTVVYELPPRLPRIPSRKAPSRHNEPIIATVVPLSGEVFEDTGVDVLLGQTRASGSRPPPPLPRLPPLLDPLPPLPSRPPPGIPPWLSPRLNERLGHDEPITVPSSQGPPPPLPGPAPLDSDPPYFRELWGQAAALLEKLKARPAPALVPSDEGLLGGSNLASRPGVKQEYRLFLSSTFTGARAVKRGRDTSHLLGKQPHYLGPTHWLSLVTFSDATPLFPGNPGSRNRSPGHRSGTFWSPGSREAAWALESPG